MRRFKSAGQLQRFGSVHGVVQNLRAGHHRLLRTRAFADWDAVTCPCVLRCRGGPLTRAQLIAKVIPLQLQFFRLAERYLDSPVADVREGERNLVGN